MSNDFTDHEQRVEEAPPAEHAKDQLRIAVQNARSFERELLVAKLEAELFNDGEGADEHERGFRAGWNSRARSIVEQLRSGR
jgi:hypothetical protein